MFQKTPYYFFILFSVLHASIGMSQVPADSLQEVKISGKKKQALSIDQRKAFSIGQQTQTLDSLVKEFYQTQSLAQLISDQSTVFVKSYGVNGLASLSFRGASAAQSSVLWNGIPLSSPTLGMADISLFPSGLFDQISLQYGSSSALFGSGNVGGALILENDLPDFTKKKQTKLVLGMGSFQKYGLTAQSLFQNERWRIKGNFFHQSALNNFEYEDQSGNVKKMENARIRGFGAMATADYNLGSSSPSDHIFSLHVWYQNYFREIPPALFESFSVKKQLDQSFRSLLHWQKKQNRSSFYAKVSWNQDILNFQDGVVIPENQNTVMQFYSEAGWNWQIDRPLRKEFPLVNHHLLVFVPIQYGKSLTEDRKQTRDQWRPALVAAYRLQTRRENFSLNTALRQEWVDAKNSAFLPGVSTYYQIIQWQQDSKKITVDMRGNIQKSYRLPTLNELYFSPGGNPNLKPERGWNEDAGFVFTYETGHAPSFLHGSWKIKQETNLFNRNIEDWIYWLGGAIWTPHNLAEVHSRGIETNNQLSCQIADWLWDLGLQTSYVLSTTTSSYMPNDGSIGKQIPYAPRYAGQVNLGLHFKSLVVHYNHHYTGYRFVTVDESQYLKPYQTGNLQMMYQWNLKDYRIGLAAQILNLWDVEYAVVNARPMPGRNFLLNLQLIF